MTPTELATQLKVDPKALRRWLRANATRPADKKGTNWAIDRKTATRARKAFAKKG